MALAEWVEAVEADNAEATATRAAEAGNHHVLLGIIASYTTSGTSGECRIEDATTEIGAFQVHDNIHVDFGDGLPITPGNALNVDLDPSGGAANLGQLIVYGRTER